MAEILEVIDDQLEYEPYDTEFLSRNMDEFFSFYGFYQDMINELQDNCDYEGKLIPLTELKTLISGDS